jgi:hypothetical protein
MKQFLLAALMAAGLGLSAQQLPNPWDGLNTEAEQRELFGEPQNHHAALFIILPFGR